MEANVVGVFTEALTANVEVILADQAGLMGADSAVREAIVERLEYGSAKVGYKAV